MTGTHESWHPGESPDYISAASDRVRRQTMSESGTGIKREWFHGGGELTERELVGVMRRMNRRSQTLAEYHAHGDDIPTHGFTNAQQRQPTVRVCAGCGITFMARSATTKYHDSQCARRAYKARQKAGRTA